MIIHEIALRYTKALLNLCPGKEARLQTLKALEEVLKLLDSDDNAAKFFVSPKYSFKQKQALLTKLLGGESDALLLKYFFFLLKRDRFKYLKEIYQTFRRAVYVEQGICEGSLTTAAAQEAAAKEVLIHKLEALYNVKLRLQEKIDPKLIGGGIVMIGNRQWDFSVKGRLERLKKSLLKHSFLDLDNNKEQ